MYEQIASLGLFGNMILLIGGLAILILGGEVLVRGASRLALAMRISPLVVGLTIVAFCTSAPEMAVSVIASLKGQGEIAVGNIFGSCICNILLILGLCALAKPIAVSAKLIRQEIPLLLTITTLICLFAIFVGYFPQWFGCVLLFSLFIYLAWTIYQIRRDGAENALLVQELEEEVVGKERPETVIASSSSAKVIIFSLLAVLAGLGLLVLGSDSMVFGASNIADSLGISQRIIGLTIVAVGTSLPELVVSVVAARRGEADIAVGNVVGSNIFNLLGVLGPTALLSKGGLQMPGSTIFIDIPITVLVTIFCLVICVTDRLVTRKEGIFLLGCYIAYTGYLVFFSG